MPASRRLAFGFISGLVVAAHVGCSSSFSSSGGDLGLLDPLAQRSAKPEVDVSSTGVTPAVLHLDATVTVSFVNGDSVPHTFAPAPELKFGDCPELAGFKAIPPGQTGTVTFARSAFICAFHETSRASDVAFQGLIVIH